MLLQFKNKRISSIISVIPANEVNFMDEIGNYSFTETQMKKLKKVMGFDKRRVSLHGETVSDYAIKGISTLIEEGVIKENEIGAIVVQLHRQIISYHQQVMLFKGISILIWTQFV